MRATALVRLMRAELRGRRLRSMVLFVAVIAVASAAMVAGFEGQSRAGERWDAAFVEANGAHVTVAGSPEAVAAVASRAEVAASTHPYRRTIRELDVVRDGSSIVGAMVREMPEGHVPTIAVPLLRDGRWVKPGAGYELVLDRAFGLDEGFDVGDKLSLQTPGGPATFTVVGRAIDLVDCFYPNCDPVTAWVDPAGFERLGVDAVSMAFMRLHDPQRVEQFMASLAGAGVATQDWADTRADALGTYEMLGAFLGAFGVFVMIAAAVVVAGAMATRAVARRREIGLLKAVGTTPRQVAASIMLSHAAAAAVGVAIGWLLGGLLAPLVQVDLGETLGTGGAAFSLAGLARALVAVELIVVATTVLPAWRAGRLPTAAALAPVVARPARGRMVGRMTGRATLGPVGLAGVRDALGRPARSVLTALAVALAVVAILASLGVQRSMDRIFTDTALVGDPGDLRVYPTGPGAAALPGILDSEPGVASWFTEREQGLVMGEETFLGIAIGGDVARAGFVVREGRMLVRNGEAVAGWGWLDRFGLEVGDEVTVLAAGKPIDLTIVGWYRESEDTGQILRFSMGDLARVLPDVTPQWASVHVAEGAAPADVAAALRSRLGRDAEVAAVTIEGSDEVDAFRLAFLLVSVLVVIVALANLGSTMVLAVRERTHDLGVLRAVGVTPRQVIELVASSGVALAVGAVLIGVPLAWMVSAGVTEAVGSASGMGPGIGVGPGLAGVLVVVPLTVVLAVLLGALAARRGATAQVSDLVRYE